MICTSARENQIHEATRDITEIIFIRKSSRVKKTYGVLFIFLVVLRIFINLYCSDFDKK